jgi:hypothetical protein
MDLKLIFDDNNLFSGILYRILEREMNGNTGNVAPIITDNAWKQSCLRRFRHAKNGKRKVKLSL